MANGRSVKINRPATLAVLRPGGSVKFAGNCNVRSLNGSNSRINEVSALVSRGLA